MNNSVLANIKVVLNDRIGSHPLAIELGHFIQFNLEMNHRLAKMEKAWEHTSTPMSLVQERLHMNKGKV